MKYLASCVHLPAKDIEEIVNRAKETSYNAVLGKVGSDELRAIFPHYNWTRSKKGLAMSQDYHIRYYRSNFRGKKCYFIVHSAIEYVFC